MYVKSSVLSFMSHILLFEDEEGRWQQWERRWTLELLELDRVLKKQQQKSSLIFLQKLNEVGSEVLNYICLL